MKMLAEESSDTSNEKIDLEWINYSLVKHKTSSCKPVKNFATSTMDVILLFRPAKTFLYNEFLQKFKTGINIKNVTLHSPYFIKLDAESEPKTFTTDTT